MKTLIILIIISLPSLVFAAYMRNLPTQVTQPDGTALNLFATGDEFANRLHDSNGYTIIQSQTDGFYYYAQRIGDELAPSAWKAGTVDPADKNLVPNLNISDTEYRARVSLCQQNENPDIRTPQTGTVNNLCIFIRFSDQTEFTIPRSAYDLKFNAAGANANSLRNYFLSTSYHQLDIITSMYPSCQPEVNLSYQDSHPRDYYVPYNATTNPIGYVGWDQLLSRQQILLSNAINSVSAQIPANLDIDADDNNYVDNVCFIVRGAHTAYGELLWGRSWDLTNPETFINGLRVLDYTFIPENQNDVMTLCHEMFHSIGAPDLYHYNLDGVDPCGMWDIMDVGLGHMGAHMKNKYGGWLLEPIIITQTGDYTLNPITSAAGNHYQINVAGLPGESVQLEYRKKGSDVFESNIPDSGLLIYHIRSNLTGNATGPDEVYLYRPDGAVGDNGRIHQAAFSADQCRTEFNDFTNPNCLLANSVLGHVNISNVGLCGETISFHYTADSVDLPPTLGAINPSDHAVLVPGFSYSLSINATAHGSSVSQIDFNLDGSTVATFAAPPYVHWWVPDQTDLGWHEFTVTAISSSGLVSHARSAFRVLDPQVENWFTWTSDNPDYYSIGSGPCGSSPTPVIVAVDFDLGDTDFVVKKLAFNLEDDPYGDPAIPGLVSATINRFTNGAITNQILLDLGDFTIPLNGHQEVDIDNDTILNGKIALIVNTYEYQNIMLDRNGTTGHSWLNLGYFPWMETQSLSSIGAADIGLKLQSPYVGNDENLAISATIVLTNYPNPFNPETTISYTLPSAGSVSLDIYNSRGQLVRSLLQEEQPAGEYSLVWNGKDGSGHSVASGLYLCRIASNGTHVTRKMLLIK